MLVFRGVVSKTLLFPICLRPFTSKNGHLPIVVGVQMPFLKLTANFPLKVVHGWLQMRCLFLGPGLFSWAMSVSFQRECTFFLPTLLEVKKLVDFIGTYNSFWRNR